MSDKIEIIQGNTLEDDYIDTVVNTIKQITGALGEFFGLADMNGAQDSSSRLYIGKKLQRGVYILGKSGR